MSERLEAVRVAVAAAREASLFDVKAAADAALSAALECLDAMQEEQRETARRVERLEGWAQHHDEDAVKWIEQ